MHSKELQRDFVHRMLNGENFYHSHLKSKIGHMLASSFVLTYEAVGPDVWAKIIGDFLPRLKVSGENILDLSTAFYNQLNLEPPLKELAQFEYLLIELFYMEDNEPKANQLIPEHRLIHFEYAELPSYLLLYRHPKQLTVELIELSELYFLGLTFLAETPSIFLALEQAAKHLNVPLVEEKDISNFFDALYIQGAFFK